MQTPGRYTTKSLLPLVACLSLAASVTRGGTIGGTVFNTSSGTAVPCQTEVVLQAQVERDFTPIRVLVSDHHGRFLFSGLPIGDDYLYRVGANRNGVFYPGPRICLTAAQPTANAELSVCDAVAAPCPLVLREMDVTIHPEAGLLKVTELLVIDNPSHTCFVGEANAAGQLATLALGIPADFEKVTFDEEFFGRRFALLDNKVATDIPWTPGQRRLRYTYLLHNTQTATAWQRPLDLPCDKVTIRIESTPANEVHCDLAKSVSADGTAVVYASAEKLPAGHVLRVELGRLPLPWMAYGKWAAVAVLLLMLAAGTWRRFHHAARHRVEPPTAIKGRRTKFAA